MNKNERQPADQHEAATPFTKWPWQAQFAFALFILVTVTVLLVGLPVASMLIVERMSPGSLVGTVSFWGASFAAFISLAVVFIGGVFAFTALKVEAEARLEAGNAARDEVKKVVIAEVSGTVREKITEYLDKDGNEITKGAANEYLKINGPDITQAKADEYLKTGGASIIRQATEQYLDESIEGEGMTKGEKVARKVAEKFSTEDIERLINEGIERQMDERLSRLASPLSKSRPWYRRILGSQDRPDDPNSRDTH